MFPIAFPIDFTISSAFEICHEDTAKLLDENLFYDPDSPSLFDSSFPSTENQVSSVQFFESQLMWNQEWDGAEGIQLVDRILVAMDVDVLKRDFPSK